MKKLNIKKNTNPKISQEAHELNQYAWINDVSDWQDLMGVYQQLKQQVAPKKVLLILEDIGQCNYTSMHASMNDALYFDPSEYIGEVNGQEEDILYENSQPLAIKYYLEQLSKAENQVEFKNLKAKSKYSQADFDLLIQIHEHPEKILDSAIETKLVNVELESEKFVAQLNGYFSCDFNPMESFSLIQYLEKNFAFEYIGLGASLFFFIKTAQFNSINNQKLIDELTTIYGFDSTIVDFLKKHLMTHDYLILPYVESLEVFEGCLD